MAKLPGAEECTADSDCAEGFLCAVDQGRCLPGDQAAPRAHLGFDIREQAAGSVVYRVEVDGCDCVVDDRDLRELVLRFPAVSQELALTVDTADAVGELVAGVKLPAQFRLSQISRFGEEPSLQRSPSLRHPVILELPEGSEEEEEALPTIFRWPRHHPMDRDVPPELILWEIEPEGGLARRYLGLVPPVTDDDLECDIDSDCCEGEGCNPAPNFCDTSVGECTAIGYPEWKYHYNYQPACSRGFGGLVVPVDLTAETPVQGNSEDLEEASITVRYADPADGRFGLSVYEDIPAALRPPQCNINDDCDTGQYCDQNTRQCFVGMAGLFAGSDSADETGQFSTEVYTYCDGNIDNEELTRRLNVTVAPPGPRPTVNFVIDATFGEPSNGDFTTAQPFCVPDWGPSAPIEIEFNGVPQTLISGEDEYVCCDVGCLPATAEDLEEGAGRQPAPERCDGRTGAGAPPDVEVESFFLPDSTTNWQMLDCLTPVPDISGRLGSFSNTAQCTSPSAPCLVDEVALGTADNPRTYEVRFTSQVGSVVASQNFVIDVGDEQPDIISLPLTPRVLITGVVDVDQETCNRRETPGDCAAREAVVLAERLRMPGEEDANIPGPYFHSVPTYYDPVAQRDGAFVLPLDPGGVYVVTALPLAGAEGGPSGFALVNLRGDAEEPVEPLTLELEEGVLVSLRLDGFDFRTAVIPMDRGSFLAPGRTLTHPARAETDDSFIDLNRPNECWIEDGFDGCQIRRLIPPGSDLARSQVGIARFTARQAGRAECTNECPLADPAP